MYLILILKKKWFEMWKSGEKPEDYREMSEYWAKRLCKNYDRFCTTVFASQIKTPCFYRVICPYFKPKNYDGIILKCGYPKKGDKEKEIIIETPPTICIGTGKTEWGAEPNKLNFVIKKKKV